MLRKWIDVKSLILLSLIIAVAWIVGESVYRRQGEVSFASLGREGVSAHLQQCVANSKLQTSPLPLPSSLTNPDYQRKLFEFLRTYQYRDRLNWASDKRVRDTGDFIKGAFNEGDYNGTHPAVVVYYSPEVYCWLLTDRKGAIPDGAMIIKEMYPPPAARYVGANVRKLPTPMWTLMVKDSKASFDGWYWSGVFDELNERGERVTLQDLDVNEPGEYPESGFGSYCINCHASAEKEFTFVSLNNLEEGIDPITGKQRKPIEFRDDKSWRNAQPLVRAEAPTRKSHSPHFWIPIKRKTKHRIARLNDAVDVLGKLADFTYFLAPAGERGAQLSKLTANDLQKFPPESFDRVWQSREGHQFITSDQCMGCHAGDNSSRGQNMYLEKGGADDNGMDVSPWGEWRWSMMGLSGRDPVFYAQVESEIERFKNATGKFNANNIADTCLHCHGVMGQRQFHLDLMNHPSPNTNKNSLFSPDTPFQLSSAGALARDGVSCTVCHQMADNSRQPLREIMTGQFSLLPKTNNGFTILGPYDNPKKASMEAALNLTPVRSDFLKSSRLCASCHSVHLPVLDNNGDVKSSGFEQSTYLEWLNSEYADRGAHPQSCQNCHMPDSYRGETLGFKIANIQDKDFPYGTQDGKPMQAHHMRPMDEITLEKRTPFRRHMLNGINVFSLEFFRQFENILGRRKSNYWNALDNGVDSAIQNGQQMAETQTARVKIENLKRQGNKLRFTVRVTNLAGHRFPSGVAFRRAFLDVSVKGKGGVIFHSGGTNSVGMIVDRSGNPLDFQPHYQRITSDKQAQVYEELVADETGAVTTSFFKIFKHLKDNRLLPKGWSKNPPPDPTVEKEFFESTMPVGEALKDPDFTSGKGEDLVEYEVSLPASESGILKVNAQLYYQALPPYYLKDRFASGRGPATDRLYYLASHLQTEGTPIDGWKLRIAGDDQSFGKK